MPSPENHEGFMRRALELARGGWGTSAPNPMVGAVIVEEGRIVAEGFHEKDGGPHAERVALAALGRPPRPGAALYSTLEPCSTHGRTGPCTEAILASGIRRVVVGAMDPTPEHAGNGFEILRRAGVEVVPGVLEAECADLNLIFNHWITTGGPLLAAKSAATLDGRIACRTGDSQWITGGEARAAVHRWRRLFPAIAAGAGTVAKDNPRLTARLPGKPEWCPIRFVFDGLLSTFVERNLPRVYTDEFREKTIVVTTTHGGAGYVRKLRDLGVRAWVFESANQRVPFQEFRRRCSEERIDAVFFEGGAQLVSRMIRDRQLDYLFVYRGPLLLADDRSKPMLSGLRTETLADAIRLADVRHEILGEDTLTRGRMSYPRRLQADETALA
jgi:diaminohydroxyphosphoribosylaminopyrimidine deaminase/5-amino-6-(5-phosphoribosylamino)uracil reductase